MWWKSQPSSRAVLIVWLLLKTLQCRAFDCLVIVEECVYSTHVANWNSRGGRLTVRWIKCIFHLADWRRPKAPIHETRYHSLCAVSVAQRLATQVTWALNPKSECGANRFVGVGPKSGAAAGDMILLLFGCSDKPYSTTYLPNWEFSCSSWCTGNQQYTPEKDQVSSQLVWWLLYAD